MQADLQFSELAAFSREGLEQAIRARVQTVPLGEGRVLARILGGRKIFLSTTDLGFSCHVMLDGYWESWLTLFFAKRLSAGMTVFDVGANFGYYTLLFGAGVGPTGCVVAIEPVPATNAMLVDSIELNGFSSFTRVVSAAATANSRQEVHLLVPPREPKNSAIIDQAQEGSVVVPSCTIDELAADFDRVDLIKIDVEGAEMDVIAGMRGTIKRFRPDILLEYNAARYTDPRAFLDGLLAVYGMVRIVDWDGSLKQTSADTILNTRFGEDWLLFFSHKSA